MIILINHKKGKKEKGRIGLRGLKELKIVKKVIIKNRNGKKGLETGETQWFNWKRMEWNAGCGRGRGGR